MAPRREQLVVTDSEAVGLYSLLRLERGSLEPGIPGQFFMLEAPGRVLPRALSLCLAPPGELAFLLDPVGPGTEALCELDPGDRIHVFGPLGNGYRLDVERPLIVGGGVGLAPLPYLAEALEQPPAVLGFRSDHHAEAAALMPNAEVVIDPVLVTDAMPSGPKTWIRSPRSSAQSDSVPGPTASRRNASSPGGARQSERARGRRRPGASSMKNCPGVPGSSEPRSSRRSV